MRKQKEDSCKRYSPHSLFTSLEWADRRQYRHSESTDGMVA